jgi:hypothetical protein
MNGVRFRWVAAGFAVLALTMLNACAVTGVGVEGTVGAVGYDAGYYEPYGYEYGGWGPAYRVGPGRGGDRRGDWHGGDRGGDHGGQRGGDRGGQRGGDRGGQPSRSYRPAPASRPIPSIPRGSRGH